MLEYLSEAGLIFTIDPDLHFFERTVEAKKYINYCRSSQARLEKMIDEAKDCQAEVEEYLHVMESLVRWKQGLNYKDWPEVYLLLYEKNLSSNEAGSSNSLRHYAVLREWLNDDYVFSDSVVVLQNINLAMQEKCPQCQNMHPIIHKIWWTGPDKQVDFEWYDFLFCGYKKILVHKNLVK